MPRVVSVTGDFKRIENLPRRPFVWNQDPEIPKLRALLSALYAKAGAFEPYDIQIMCLKEAFEQGGGFFPVDAGGGKTWISLMLPIVFGAERPVLLVPPDLREKTLRKSIPMMEREWVTHPNLRVIGYSEISQEKNANLLFELDPDLIIADEVHSLSARTSGRTKRVERFIEARRHVPVIELSGTMTDKSLRDYWHLMQWALGAYDCPMPLRRRDMEEWADALDEEVDEAARALPGALIRFCEKGETPRQGYRRRVQDTYGVITSLGDRPKCSLVISKVEGLRPTKEVWKLIEKVRNDWEDPNGNPIMEAPKKAALAKQIALGYWLRWDPPAPIAWLEARREWARFVRKTLARNQRGLDTELQVYNEQLRRENENVSTAVEWSMWRAIKDTFTPNPVAEWVSDFAVVHTTKWLRDNPRGIAWVGSPHYGAKVAEYSGYRYFGEGEEASIDILDVTGPIIASITVHGKGKDLQDRYETNLITMPPSSGRKTEQLLARTHRKGQPADTVRALVYLFTEELAASFRRACGRARYIEDTQGGRQRLNYADITFDI